MTSTSIDTLAGNANPPTMRKAWLLRMGGLRSRVMANMGALLVGQGVTAGIQLLSLPVFLYVWDAQRYGKWVLLSAVPAYFSMSDAGMIPVAGNKVTMLLAADRTDAGNAVFQSALALVLGAFFCIGTVAGLVLAALPDSMLASDSRLALWLLILCTLLGLFAGLFGASFRACGKNARGVLYNDGIRVLEFAGLAAGLVAGQSFVSAALGMLCGRLLSSLIVGNECRRLCPQLHWSIRRASRGELRALARPALGYLAFPLANGLSIQAITLVVGALFGSVAVAIFNTYRTLSRLVLQITSTLSHAMAPEFSRLYGAADGGGLRRLYRRAVLGSGVLSTVASLAMVALAPYILRIWTHGKIPFDFPLFLLFALATLVGGLAHVPRMLLMATNRHSRLGVLYLAISAGGVALALGLGHWLGTSGPVLAMTAPEAGMLALALVMGGALLRDMPADARATPVPPPGS
jgi:O-antigen/teichoic acid export membrane protein